MAEHEFIDRLFYYWDTSHRGALSFQVSVALSFFFSTLFKLIERRTWFSV